jgi:hypothetical protein
VAIQWSPVEVMAQFMYSKGDVGSHCVGEEGQFPHDAPVGKASSGVALSLGSCAQFSILKSQTMQAGCCREIILSQFSVVKLHKSVLLWKKAYNELQKGLVLLDERCDPFRMLPK